MPLPRPTASGKVDITGARMFLEDQEGHRALVDLVATFSKEQKVRWDDRDVLYHIAIRITLRSMHAMYKIWTKREVLSPSDLSFYHDNLSSFRQCWRSLAWNGTVWIHWVCAHSEYFLTKHLSWQCFTSVPTEMRHQIWNFWIFI